MPNPTPADRAFRALADAAGQSRPRHPHDGVDPDVPVAATVVIVRDGSDGPDVLMIERPDRGSFAGAWVFPGGKLEDVDRAGADEPEAARRAGVRETSEEIGIELDAGALVALSCWDPPPGLPLRIRTWFFVASDPGTLLALSPEEVVAAEWVRPAEMLARHSRGEVTLYPPTWVTLHGLAQHPDAGSLLDTVRISGLERFETVARRGDEGPMMLWEGDASYADEHGTAGSRHRLELGELPWIYRRSD